MVTHPLAQRRKTTHISSFCGVVRFGAISQTVAIRSNQRHRAVPNVLGQMLGFWNGVGAVSGRFGLANRWREVGRALGRVGETMDRFSVLTREEMAVGVHWQGDGRMPHQRLNCLGVSTAQGSPRAAGMAEGKGPAANVPFSVSHLVNAFKVFRLAWIVLGERPVIRNDSAYDTTASCVTWPSDFSPLASTTRLMHLIVASTCFSDRPSVLNFDSNSSRCF